MKLIKKRNLIIVLSLAMVGLFSCEAIKDNLTVNIPVEPDPIDFTVVGESYYDEAEKIIGENNAENENVLFETTVPSNLLAQLEKEGKSIKNLSAFKFKTATVKLKKPEDFDMSAFIGMKLYLGENRDLVAEATSVTDNNKTLVLTISQDNLMKYADTERLPIRITGARPVSVKEVAMTLYMKFNAAVKP